MRRYGWIAALALAAPAAAHADSGVTVWGRVGGDVQYLSGVQNGAHSTGARFSEGNDWGTSILGLTGKEDLGGGNQAVFWLESAINAANGNYGGGVLFQRGAWVGLKNERYGFVRLGQGSFINSYIWSYDPLLEENYSVESLTSYRNGPKLSNGIRYESPKFGGFSFALQANLGNSANGWLRGSPNNVSGTGLADGATVAFTQGDFEVRAIWNEIRNQNGREDNLLTASQEAFIGVRDRFGPALVQLGYTRYSAPDTPAGLARTANYYWGGVTYDATPFLHLQGAVYSMKIDAGQWTADHSGEGRSTIVGLGTMYDLSKRTFLYATAAHVFNSANANFGVNPQGPGLGNGNGLGASPLPGHGQTGVYAGIETLF